jgi:hypothetical protein
VTPEGELYLWVGSSIEITRYVLIFKPDGSYKSRIKLQPGFPWIPASIAVFANGSLLMTGQEFVHGKDSAREPFTGIFSSDGNLMKRLSLADDDPTNNRAVAWGQMAAAKDGNIYVTRWLSPAILYAVSPGGEVVRRITVDPGDPATCRSNCTSSKTESLSCSGTTKPCSRS